MRASTITTNLPATQIQDRPATHLLRRAGRWIGVATESVAATWSAIADAGQLGPTDSTRLGRHTGARI